MARFALIEIATGRVVNMVALLPQEGLEPGHKDHWEPPAGHIIVESNVAGPGWTYLGGAFSPPETEG